MNEHPFIYLEDCFGEKVKIDKKISELLKLIWNLDLYTLNSCQENKPGKIWIHFIDTDNAERFLKLILSKITDMKKYNYLYSRILNDHSFDESLLWEYDIILDDFRDAFDIKKESWYTDFNKPCDIGLSVSIRFPISDYKTLCDILKDK